jgi:SAM-dependent methyltransferase
MLRRLARAVVPGRLRAELRRAVRDLPVRLRDFGSDWRPGGHDDGGLPVPPPRLRFRVGSSSSRAEFLRVGGVCAEDLLKAYRTVARPADADGRWLDFGSGCGRVARHLLGRPPISDYTGVDVDADQIAWAARNLPGRFATIPRHPPTALPSESFDVVFSVSVFTHLDEAAQMAWLEELRRVLRPGGLLIATTHSPRIAIEGARVSSEERVALERRGFLFRRSVGPFNEQASFHSKEYLRATWSPAFRAIAHLPFALGGYQDISLWERAADAR